MAPKGKKKKAAKPKEEKKAEGDGLPVDIPEHKIPLPKHGWMKLTLKLCQPSEILCSFDENMLTNSRIRSVYQKIIDYHGRIENIKLFD